MTRQISMDAALAAFEAKCAELLRANVLLEAQVSELESQNQQLQEQASPGVAHTTADDDPGAEPGRAA